MNLNPTDFLLPTPALTKETLRQTSLLYSEAFTALPVDVAMSQLEIGGDWDTEQVWQQMMLFNGPAVGGMRRTLTGFEEEMKGREQRVQVVESVSEEELEEDDLEDSEQEEEIDDESEQDIIDEEMKESIASEENEEEDPEQDSDGDSELRAMMSDNEDADGSSPAATSSKSNRKSIVDDEFFSLQDMQDFSEKAEAWDEIQQGRNEEEDDDEDEAVNEFDLGLDPDGDKSNDESDEEDEDNANDIMYEDFFGPREPTKKIEPAPKFRQELKDDDLDGYYSTPAEKAPPSPTFEDIAQPAAADLFQDVNMSANLSSFERNQEKLTTRIAALEGQAVADKAWQLAGESTAKSRPVNALLGEADLGIDYASKPVPIISVDSTLGLEERIKARIRDGIFDSVERKIVTIDKRRMKKDRTGEDEKSGQSLVQVYEKEYLRQSAEVKTAVVEKEESKEELEAIALYAVLVDQLDALSNSHYTPVREVPGGMEVVVQAPAISVEEVIPGHVSNAQLVAPGDVYRAGLKQSRGEMESVDLRREKRGRKAKGRKEGAKAEVKKSDGSSGGAVKELLGMDNVTMIKGKDGAVGDDKGGKKRKAKVMEEGGEIGAKGGRSSANFIRL